MLKAIECQDEVESDITDIKPIDQKNSPVLNYSIKCHFRIIYMSSVVIRIRAFLMNPIQIVSIIVIMFMLLNAFLPQNFLPVRAETTTYPFKLTITLEKSVYELGEWVNVTWTLVNLGEENVTLYTSRDLFDFIVYDENFAYVFRYGKYTGFLAVYLPFSPIPPSGNKTLTRSWKQIYDPSATIPPEMRSKAVQSGMYYIVSVFDSATYNVILKTPAIRITIVANENLRC